MTRAGAGAAPCTTMTTLTLSTLTRCVQVAPAAQTFTPVAFWLTLTVTPGAGTPSAPTVAVDSAAVAAPMMAATSRLRQRCAITIPAVLSLLGPLGFIVSALSDKNLTATLRRLTASSTGVVENAHSSAHSVMDGCDGCVTANGVLG